MGDKILHGWLLLLFLSTEYEFYNWLNGSIVD